MIIQGVCMSWFKDLISRTNVGPLGEPQVNTELNNDKTNT
jgi:hypothetical protein